jgi:maltooligosyltrehalose trehalohydrolase
MRTGASYKGWGVCSFTVWAPLLREVSLKIISPEHQLIPMLKDEKGYWKIIAENIFPGTLYYYRLNDTVDRPDPSSHHQPDGVHGPSEVVDHGAFDWEDSGWSGQNLEDYIIYELHVGTFTKEGTFDAIIPHVKYLKELGVTALELMPISQFPGARNWGYDGTYPYAAQNSYGGPDGLKRLINECHKQGLAVILDVVYNHLGPEGNYLGDYGPYFTDKYRTPWGDAINFDGPYSDDVRNFFIYNAVYWVTLYHVDALRIDAIHGIFDASARHFLRHLCSNVHKTVKILRRNIHIMAESDLNDVRVINPAEIGGYGLDAQWNDDFHHCLHTLITGESKGYYQDFGTINHLAKAYREGYVYSGQYSRYRKRAHGNSSKDRPCRQFIVFSQNHDQVGNRLPGDRLSRTQSIEKLKLAAGVVILSPFIPLLFMGEEYGETAPFQYFVSHSDAELIEAVRKGRSKEFEDFKWKGTMPDPQAEETFLLAKINTELHLYEKHKIIFEFYKHIIRMRKEILSSGNYRKNDIEIRSHKNEKTLFVKIFSESVQVFSIYNFSESTARIDINVPDCGWDKILDSSSKPWGGSGEISVPEIKKGEIDVTLKINAYSVVFYRSLTCARRTANKNE